jgi:farnesyl-diphosphate farnesyltransferase
VVSTGEAREPEELRLTPPTSAQAELDDLLRRTSRTFALAIPLLPIRLRREVGLSYLLLRIADTLEDAELWTSERAVAELHDWAATLDTGAGSEALAGRWSADPPTADVDCNDLLRRTPAVVAALGDIHPASRRLIADHASSTARGMAEFVARGRRVRTIEELRHYCWVVAGSIGELLTELFTVCQGELRGVHGALRERAASFGEALQLVNILNDFDRDRAEGRSFVPASAGFAEVMAMAKRALAIGGEYLKSLEKGGAAPGVVAFCALPLRLAEANLERLLAAGPGARLDRETVARILRDVAPHPAD